MAKPNSKQGLIDYCLRQLGAPVLEINVADDQLDDLLDDALQLFNERHYDGVERMYLKHEVTQDDIDRGEASGTSGVGIVTTTAESTAVSGIGTTTGAITSTWYENSNFLQIPDSVIGVEKIFKFDTSSISGGMFSIKYQLFLNDLYQFNSIELLQYSMVKTYLEDIDFLLTTDKQIRFNQRQDRLYLDIDWSACEVDEFIVLECFRLMNPNDYTRVWNDSFLKRYATALIKKQWGQNLLKFQGVKLPGGIEMNGRQIYDDAEKELEIIREQMSNTYELPPLDMIG